MIEKLELHSGMLANERRVGSWFPEGHFISGQRVRDMVFILAVLFLCTVPSGITLFYRGWRGQVEHLGMENRMAERFPAITWGAVTEGEFQRGMERSLAEQLPRRTQMVMAWRRFEQTLCWWAYQLRPDLDLRPIDGRGYWENGGQLLAYYARSGADAEQVTAGAAAIRELAKAFPHVHFHVHVVRTSDSLDFLNRHTGYTKRTEPLIETWRREVGPGVTYSETRATSLEELREMFYRSDHHWMPEAAYAAYVQLTVELGLGEPLPAGDLERLEGSRMVGSRARQCAFPPGFEDVPTFYRPPAGFAAIKVNGVEQPRSRLDGYLAGEAVNPASLDTYGDLFGLDCALATYQRSDAAESHLLLLGDSMTQALERWLAWHFRETSVVDVRHWERTFGQRFDLARYLVEHSVSHVVWLGQYWTVIEGQEMD